MTASFFEDPEMYLATSSKILISDGKYKSANVLAASSFKMVDNIDYQTRYSQGIDWECTIHNFNLVLDVNSSLYSQIVQDISEIEGEIYAAISMVLRGRDFNHDHHEYYFNSVILSILDPENKDWRSEVRKILSAGGISNQGRVRSDNIAPHEHKGLLFRSPPEIELFDALTRAGILFTPLPVFIKNANGNRIEPDFLIFKDGSSLIVEVDGRNYHRESPLDAQNRLDAFKSQGVDSLRVDAGRLNSPAGANEVVKEITDYIERMRRLK